MKADPVKSVIATAQHVHALLYGLDLEGTIGNVFVRAHYSINGKYKQYPTIPKNQVGFSRLTETIEGEDGEESTGTSIDPVTNLPVDGNGIPTYSETEGERFEAMLGGDGTDEDGDGIMGRETAWFVQLKSRFGKLYLEGVYYHIDPGYTTTYLNFGSNSDRDQPYSLPTDTGIAIRTRPVGMKPITPSLKMMMMMTIGPMTSTSTESHPAQMTETKTGSWTSKKISLSLMPILRSSQTSST